MKEESKGRKRLSIIGSTGSLGTQTLDVVRRHPGRFEVVALAGGRNGDLLLEQAREFRPRMISIADGSQVPFLRQELEGSGIEVSGGMSGLREVAAFSEADLLVNVVVGSAGLLPTLDAISVGKDVALANKETLVAGGALVTRLASEKGTRIIPIDSEHSAIFQCLQGGGRVALKRIILTASGGPFRQSSREELEGVTPEEALRHPNWKMGGKITVDSATLMNKGLEVIEATWLFGVELSQVEVVIHPQSIIHSMVEFEDGAVLAQLGVPSMLVPIQYALTYPERFESGAGRVDFVALGALTFEEPDLERFPALGLAYEACRMGGTMPAVMNAANEVAVTYFLSRKIKFTDIPRIIEKVMSGHNNVADPSLDDILMADAWAREETRRLYEMAKGWWH